MTSCPLLLAYEVVQIEGGSDGAMVLAKRPVPRCFFFFFFFFLFFFYNSRARAYCACSRCGGGCLWIFLSSIISHFFRLLWETARCSQRAVKLKTTILPNWGLPKAKQLQPFSGFFFVHTRHYKMSVNFSTTQSHYILFHRPIGFDQAPMLWNFFHVEHEILNARKYNQISRNWAYFRLRLA